MWGQTKIDVGDDLSADLLLRHVIALTKLLGGNESVAAEVAYEASAPSLPWD
jgi:hypothetical protein